MGEEGAKASAAGAEAAAALVDDLQPVGAVSSRKMFGGHGVFCDEVMFAIVDTTGQCYLRADDETRGSFETAGAQRHGKMPYWTIPAAVRDDQDELLSWANRSVAVARAAKR